MLFVKVKWETDHLFKLEKRWLWNQYKNTIKYLTQIEGKKGEYTFNFVPLERAMTMKSNPYL
jgi:hypothetical protein